MTGGRGNDTYLVDNLGDRIVEELDGGSDSVLATIDFVLGEGVENLTLLGAEHLSGTGSASDNRINGNDGNNALHGGSGADSLFGGLGADQLFGGPGADLFIFRSVDESGIDAVDRDIVKYFYRGQGDRIDLRLIDANISLAGDQRFRLVGEDDFTGSAGELRYMRGQKVTTISGDVDGDGLADFSIDLGVRLALVEGDFLL